MIKDILEKIEEPNVLLLGDFMLDEYVWGDVQRVSQEAPIPILNVTSKEVRLGGAGNVANNLHHLGANVCCYGVVGNDDEGQDLFTDLEELGVNVSGLIESDRVTTIKTRMVGSVQSAGRGVQQLLRVDCEDDSDISQDEQSKLIHLIETKLQAKNIDVILISDMGKGVCTCAVLSDVIRLGKNNNIPVIVDPKMTDDYSIYRDASAITPNRFEAGKAIDREMKDLKSILYAAKDIHDTYRIDNVIITLDKDGMFLYKDDDTSESITTVPKNVYDVSGAGDMVLSIFGLIIGAGKGYDLASRIANVAAGIEVASLGAVPVSRDQIIKEVSKASTKVVSETELLLALEGHKANKDRIVFTNGCFDILHIGHTQYLKFAKAQGDILVVGINSNKSVKENKGDKRPFVSEHQRAEVLAALEDVDYVVMFDDPTPLDIIKKVKPDVLIKGNDWAGNVVGTEFVESYGGMVILTPIKFFVSTTDIVNTIIEKEKT
jgi:D-beta-D-heptose 7-phosphate kinase/D-beta-D-heptose 1-phosphate adenosyltransferase